MKKLSALVLTVILFFAGFVTVSAMSEADLMAKFKDTLTLNGDKYGVSSGDLAAVERYFNTYDINATDADFIATRIDTAKGIIEADGHAVFADFSTSTKQQLKTLVDEITAQTSVNATYGHGALIIKNTDGSTFIEVTRLVKQTGVESSKVAIMSSISLIIVLAGTLLVVKQARSIR